MRRWGVLVLLGALSSPAQDLAVRGRAYRADPTPANRAVVVQYAQAHPGIADLLLGSKELETRQFAEALRHLETAAKHLPELGDYCAYLKAAVHFEQEDYGRVEPALGPVWAHKPASPLVGKATILLANTYLRQLDARRAIALVEKQAGELKPQETAILLAHAHELAGDKAAAMPYFERVLTEYPFSAEAADAASDPARLAGLSVMAHLARCGRLVESGNAAEGRAELEALLPRLTGADLDLARVEIGVAQYTARAYQQAFDSLKVLQTGAPEADAERLYFLIRCARRLDLTSEFQPSLDRLAARHGQSPWRLKALIAVGDYYWLQNNAGGYEPAYRACAAGFPGDANASECQWRVAWAEYLRRAPNAADGFQQLLRQYPNSDKVSNALYFLARIAEGKGDLPLARAYYERIARAFPNYYYATLAREKLGGGELAHTQASAAAVEALNALDLGPAKKKGDFAASAQTLARTKRARLLASAGLDDLAESELRYGAKKEGQPELAAIQLAQLAGERDAPDQGIRYMKQLAPAYLRLPIEDAPEVFWKLAFPLPFRSALEQRSREQSLDPWLVAALIRQESEFNPKVVSRAKAYGLTQVLPSTGREIGRKLNLSGFRADMLFQPEINLKIGTYFLRSLLDRLQGKWEATLASYNAGPARVAKWLLWGDFREPAEFIETIPFDETRTYVQSVLRNADMYRRLYGAGKVALASSNGDHSRKDAGAAGGDRKPASPIP